MELDLPGGVGQAQEEASVKEVPVRAEWRVVAPEPDPVGIAFALIAEPRFLIKRELPVIT